MNHLCVFDMDNTLLSPDKSISSENITAIRRLQEMGVGISVATGRSYFLVRKYADQLSLTLPVITCNGGMLIAPKDSEIIWENPIQKSVLRNLLCYLLNQKADFLAYAGQMIYFSHINGRVSIFHDHNRTVSDELQAPLQEITFEDIDGVNDESLPDVVKILLYCANYEQESYLKSLTGLEVVASMDKSLDIMQKGSTKGNALRSLGELLGIPVSSIAAFGDNENDISMFTCGALGIAMGSSSPEVKEKAQYITGTNAESGVAQGIYKYVIPYFGLAD